MLKGKEVTQFGKKEVFIKPIFFDKTSTRTSDISVKEKGSNRLKKLTYASYVLSTQHF